MKIIIGLTLLAITFGANPFYGDLTAGNAADLTVEAYCTRELEVVHYT